MKFVTVFTMCEWEILDETDKIDPSMVSVTYDLHAVFYCKPLCEFRFNWNQNSVRVEISFLTVKYIAKDK